MGEFRLACHLIQFEGEEKENPEKVLSEAAEAGWDGVEGLAVSSSDELVELAVLARRYGLHIVNIYDFQARGIEGTRYNLTLGNDATEVPGRSRAAFGGPYPTDEDFERAAGSLEEVLAFCAQHDIKGFHHAHMGTMIETVVDAERLLSAAPELWLLYDTGCQLPPVFVHP